MLNWAGKSEAYHTLQSPSFKTLTPCPQESVDFDHSDNIFIEGENLDVLKILQKSYFNSVKMIYIDPPYNTGNDFVYHDNFASRLDDYQQQSGEKDENGLLKKAFVRNSKENGHYHSNWLNMMLPRLHLAKNLLKDDGVIFISIDDNEQAQLKLLCDEVFGEENFVGQIPRITKKAGKTTDLIAKNHDQLLIYQKSNALKFNQELHFDKEYKHQDEYYETRGNYKLSQTLDYGSIQYSPSLDYEIELDGRIFRAGNVSQTEMQERQKRNPDSDFCWRWSKELFSFGLENSFIVVKGDRIYTKTYENAKIVKNDNYYEVIIEPRTKAFSTLELINNQYSNDNSRKDIERVFNKKVFEYSKPINLIKRLLKLNNKNELILDFFAGSATTAHAVMQLNAEDNGNRRFICVQMPELTDEKSEAFKAGFHNIAEISKERIRRAGKQIAENNPDNPLDTGFKVFKLSDSHFKQWQSPNVENLAEQLEFFIDPVADSAEPQAMLYEILLRLGLKLSVKVRLENAVFWLDDENGKRYAILLSEANEALFNQIIEQKPLKVVTLDRLFNGNDALKKNTELQFADHNIQFLVI